MEYAATIVAPTETEALEAVRSLGWAASEIEMVDGGIYEALLEIDEASEAELQKDGEITHEYGVVSITVINEVVEI